MRGPVKEARHSSQRASRKLSQNFLVDARVADRIIACFAPGVLDRVLEIGPGHGILTERLAGRVRSLDAVELDPRLASQLAARYAASAGVAIHHGDFLRLDLDRFGPDLRVVSNVPYGIATPVLVKLIREPSVSDAVLTLQREYAERLGAPCASKSYGSISVLAQLNARIEPLFDVPGHAFRPPPRVVSRCIRLVFERVPEAPPGLGQALRELTRAAFCSRRKRLAKALELGLGRPRAEVAGLLAAASIDPGVRPDALAPEGYLRLARTLASLPG